MQLELIYSYMEYGGISGCYVREREREKKKRKIKRKKERISAFFSLPPGQS